MWVLGFPVSLKQLLSLSSVQLRKGEESNQREILYSKFRVAKEKRETMSCRDSTCSKFSQHFGLILSTVLKERVRAQEIRDEEMGHGYSLSKSQIAKGLKQFLEEEDRSILSYRYYLSLSAWKRPIKNFFVSLVEPTPTLFSKK